MEEPLECRDSYYPTTETVKKCFKKLRKYLSLEEVLTCLENSHTITLWMIENSDIKTDKEFYIQTHDEILEKYTENILDLIKDIKRYSDDLSDFLDSPKDTTFYRVYIYRLSMKEVESYLIDTYEIDKDKTIEDKINKDYSLGYQDGYEVGYEEGFKNAQDIDDLLTN